MFNDLTEKQEEIIRISLKLLAEKGSKGLTIKNIAKMNGTVESAIYRHFKNKNEILLGILNILQKNSLGGNYEENKNTLLQIETTLRQHFKTFSEYPFIVSVFFCDGLFQDNEDLSKKMNDLTKKGIMSITEIIKKGQEKGEIRSDIDAFHLSILIAGSFRMFLKNWKISNYNFDLETEGKKMSEAIIKLLKPTK